MNFVWDSCRGNETIIRKMIFGNIEDIKELLKEYGKSKLKKIFLENFHRFHGRDKSYWQLILEVSNEQINLKAKGSFRKDTGIRYFP
ncbi:hypothetical protein [Thermosipho atlanticus]|uniref:Uncharacterized protein n=1 Tax=Thermosipho atlanticus DSM 15807 TaxID=1123380 RepID=A0A1M5RNB5_9BACT|nr:hypothetical protein [Thermosipho atlanticus]SHH27827.1 hypothetical protein SAMN02745199_0525 [Thermosipho atlanticus DSM 15807]